MPRVKYPKIFLRSKNDLSKRLSHKNLSQKKALELINICLINKDNLWEDFEEKSEPKKNKYVRNASGTSLGEILELIDRKLLKPYDHLLPEYIFGGVKGKNHAKAAKNLLGKRRKRTLMTMDLTSFFEQVSQERIESFFILKAQCSERIARILGNLCCVRFGRKGENVQGNMVLARGFATSPRLAVWANINFFNKLYEIVNKELKGKDPRISIYVDDIGITASKTSDKKMYILRKKIEKIFEDCDNNHKLKLHPINTKKGCRITLHNESPEFLGARLLRNKLIPGKKSSAKRCYLKEKLKTISKLERSKIKKSYVGTQRHKKYIESL